MNKRIVWSVILVPLLVIGLIFTVGCGEPKPKMTALEVCQHVDRMLSADYTDYTVQWAEYVGHGVEYAGGTFEYEEGTWLVTVEMTPYTFIYSFNENTGKLKLKRLAYPHELR